MSIKLAPVAQVEQDVRIQVPVGKGRFTEHSISVTYKLLPASTMRAFYETPADERETDDEIMQRDVLDIRGVKGEDGKEIEFSSELLAQMMDVSYMRTAIIQGWGDTQTNRERHAAKN